MVQFGWFGWFGSFSLPHSIPPLLLTCPCLCPFALLTPCIPTILCTALLPNPSTSTCPLALPFSACLACLPLPFSLFSLPFPHLHLLVPSSYAFLPPPALPSSLPGTLPPTDIHTHMEELSHKTDRQGATTALPIPTTLHYLCPGKGDNNTRLFLTYRRTQEDTQNLLPYRQLGRARNLVAFPGTWWCLEQGEGRHGVPHNPTPQVTGGSWGGCFGWAGAGRQAPLSCHPLCHPYGTDGELDQTDRALWHGRAFGLGEAGLARIPGLAGLWHRHSFSSSLQPLLSLSLSWVHSSGGGGRQAGTRTGLGQGDSFCGFSVSLPFYHHLCHACTASPCLLFFLPPFSPFLLTCLPLPLCLSLSLPFSYLPNKTGGRGSGALLVTCMLLCLFPHLLFCPLPFLCHCYH